MKEIDVSMVGGPGVIDYFCASDAEPGYAKTTDEIPIELWDGHTSLVGSKRECEQFCDADASCLGYTTVGESYPTTCWFYFNASGLQLYAGANWWQKPGQEPLPSAGYNETRGEIPTEPWDGKASLAGSKVDCVRACDTDAACLGYTIIGDSYPTTCWLYHAATSMRLYPTANWFQKPGLAPLPGPPPPTPLPACSTWLDTPEWTSLGCDGDGANCLLTLELLGADVRRASANVLPFQPPRAMRLAPAEVRVEVQEPRGEVVPLRLSANATALYVTLTTLAAGRFSDNALLLPVGESSVEFIPWGTYSAEEHALLKASLRVEHLEQNL